MSVTIRKSKKRGEKYPYGVYKNGKLVDSFRNKKDANDKAKDLREYHKTMGSLWSKRTKR